MILYANLNKNKSLSLDDEDLQFLADQLMKLYHTYTKKIYIKNKNLFRILYDIHEISIIIKRREYYKIFNDPSVVNYEKPKITNEESLAWNSFFALNPY